MDERFLRTEMLLGPRAMARLRAAHVCVVGLGGVGGYVSEVLARAGVGELTLIDQDVFSRSNRNRQLGALRSTTGKSKAEVTARRVLDIAPDCKVHAVARHYDAGSAADLWGDYTYVADAIDLVSCKLDLVLRARERNVPIISAMGTGNKLDASLLEITDISRTHTCPLARVMRRELGRLGVEHLKVVYSPEPPAACAAAETPPPGRRSVPGSVPWVPAAAGLMMGGAIVMDIADPSAQGAAAGSRKAPSI